MKPHAIQEVWGVSDSTFLPNKISLRVDEDRGDTKFVEALYGGKACGDQATVIKIDGKWYVGWF